MKNITIPLKIGVSIQSALVFLFVITALETFSQIRVPFKQRTSQYSPNKKIYNVKGDFCMIGNTNLTLANYTDNTNNNNSEMIYVDVDNDITTLNSSSATLTFSTENGAIPSCSNIIYAGLYWSGRARATDGVSPNTFTVTKNVTLPPTPVNEDPIIHHGENIIYTQTNMTVRNNGSIVYEFRGNNSVDFEFQNEIPYIRYRINSGNWILPDNQQELIDGNIRSVRFTPVTIFSQPSGVTLTINALERDIRDDLSLADYRATAVAYTSVRGIRNTTQTITKNFNKRTVSIKGPGATNYSTITANPNDIYYPTDTDSHMYSGYAEVTNYVKEHGLGEYTVADIATTEGYEFNTGYYGGWGLIVIYENSKMNSRSVTVFDGYGYVRVNNNFELPVSGFNTTQNGPVNIKIGVMAGEGDRTYSGDFFSIQKQSDNSWLRLRHSGNNPNNFFNSSINIDGPRNPNLLNSTGVDISAFMVPNPNNSVITNNQTSTKFRYGTNRDFYIIFLIAMAIDSYIPNLEVVTTVANINGTPVGSGTLSVLPEQEIEYKIKIYNNGTEAINNAVLHIPIPFMTKYIEGSGSNTIFFNPLPTPNTLTFNPNEGASGSIIWDIGTLPISANTSDILGELTFKLKVTDDCNILKNLNCIPAVVINGTSSGVGAITGIPITDLSFTQGYTTSGLCLGEPIYEPLSISIIKDDYVTAECEDTPDLLHFDFCNTSGLNLYSQLSPVFIPGTHFYSNYPVDSATIEYTSDNPFPVTPGTQTYYAIPPGNISCYTNFEVTITSTPVITAPANQTIEGCDTVAITGLVYSETPVTISNDQFLAAGGTIITLPLDNTITYVDTKSGTCPLIITRTFTSNGICSTNQNYVQQITISDTILPVITTPAQHITVACDATDTSLQDWLNNNGGAIATDNCGGITWTNDFNALGHNCFDSVMVTFTATDSCGNATTTAASLSSTDTIPPVAPIPPADITVDCVGAVPPMISLTAIDNCSGAITVPAQEMTTIAICPNNYIIVRTWTFIDDCGNTSSVSQNITVNDTIAPTFTVPADSTIYSDASCNYDASLAITGDVTDENDNCASGLEAVFTDTVADGNCSGTKIITRTWTLTDDCDNVNTQIQTITIMDNIAPVITTPAQNITVVCDTTNASLQDWLNRNGGATATDNCGAITWTNDFNNLTNICLDNTIITFTATDSCGNATTTTASLSSTDTIPPVAPTAPDDITVNCVDAVPEMISLTAMDNCSGAITVMPQETSIPGNSPGSYRIVRTWTFTDACKNTSSVSQNITIMDTIPPMAPVGPADITLDCDSQIPEMIRLTAIDNCLGEITVEGQDMAIPGNCPNSYTIVRTWTFTDDCGNTSYTTQSIKIIDSIAPVVPVAPADISLSCGDAIPDMISLTAIDNCSGEITVAGQDTIMQKSCPNSYTIVRTWVFTDTCGNTSKITQYINFKDETPPVIQNAPVDTTVSCSNAIPIMPTLTAIDNCSGEMTALGTDTITAGDCPHSFIITRTWIFTDACDNKSHHIQIITVSDDVAPSLTSDLETAIDTDCSNIPPVPELTFTDNCEGAVTVAYSENTTDQTAQTYSIIRTWTANDACLNTQIYTQTVNVMNTNASTKVSVALCIDDEPLDLFSLLPENTPQNGTWSADNSTVIVTGHFLNPNLLALGNYIIRYTVIDTNCLSTFEIHIEIHDRCTIQPAQSITVYSAVSPNDDGNNDVFYIDGILFYPQNSVEIYNRWGVLVFHTDSYNNTTRVFRGISEGRSTFSKKTELPEGTYYYILKYKDKNGDGHSKTGYLYLAR